MSSGNVVLKSIANTFNCLNTVKHKKLEQLNAAITLLIKGWNIGRKNNVYYKQYEEATSLLKEYKTISAFKDIKLLFKYLLKYLNKYIFASWKVRKAVYGY